MAINKLKVSNLFKFVSIVSMLILSFSIPAKVLAESDENLMELTIIKYKLSEAQLQQIHLPQSPVGEAVSGEQTKDSTGNELELMAGVKYQIDLVIPTNDASNPFEIAPNNQSQMILTDTNGQATVKLVAGIYQVTELQDEKVEKPAAPLIVQLPMTLQDGSLLNHVYLYPKSSVLTTNPKNGTPPSETTGKIPQTSGDKSSLVPIYGALITVIFIGLYGVFGTRFKRD